MSKFFETWSMNGMLGFWPTLFFFVRSPKHNLVLKLNIVCEVNQESPTSRVSEKLFILNISICLRPMFEGTSNLNRNKGGNLKLETFFDWGEKVQDTFNAYYDLLLHWKIVAIEPILFHDNINVCFINYERNHFDTFINDYLKFMFSKKATRIDKIFNVDLTLT